MTRKTSVVTSTSSPTTSSAPRPAATAPWLPWAVLCSAIVCAALAYTWTACAPCPAAAAPIRPLLALKHLQQQPNYSTSAGSNANGTALLDPVPEPLRSAVLRRWPQEAGQWREPVAVSTETDAFPFGKSFAFAMVADLDQRSRDPVALRWHSFVTLGELTLPDTFPATPVTTVGDIDTSKDVSNANNSNNGAAGTSHSNVASSSSSSSSSSSPTVTWGATNRMETALAANNRSIELSDMVWFQGRFLTVCDYTGVVYKFRPQTGEIFPRYILADGDGKEQRALKAEWMTVYGPHLLVGSHGKEWSSNGVVLARGAEWVKVIDGGGKVSSVDWGAVYQRIRAAAGASTPGYLSHEAVLWHEPARRWVFLPRKASLNGVPFDDETDESMGANLLIIVSEDLESEVTVRTVGPLEPEWGFAAVARVPGSALLLATKVREVGPVTQTKLALFDLEGKMYFPGDGFIHVAGDYKYEGIEFLGQFESI